MDDTELLELAADLCRRAATAILAVRARAFDAWPRPTPRP